MTRGFSLIEVMIAMGICSFALVSLIGLFSVGLQASRDSDEEIQAANLVSLVLNSLPTSATAAASNSPSVLAYTDLTNGYATKTTRYIGADGSSATATNAAYALTCAAGTNSLTGGSISQVYLMLSWPVQSSSTNAAGRYETLTYIPLH